MVKADRTPCSLLPSTNGRMARTPPCQVLDTHLRQRQLIRLDAIDAHQLTHNPLAGLQVRNNLENTHWRRKQQVRRRKHTTQPPTLGKKIHTIHASRLGLRAQKTVERFNACMLIYAAIQIACA